MMRAIRVAAAALAASALASSASAAALLYSASGTLNGTGPEELVDVPFTLTVIHYLDGALITLDAVAGQHYAQGGATYSRPALAFATLSFGGQDFSFSGSWDSQAIQMHEELKPDTHQISLRALDGDTAAVAVEFVIGELAMDLTQPPAGELCAVATCGGYGFQAGGFIGVLTNVTSFTIQYDADLVQTGVPEPGSWALMISGFGLAGASLRRRRRAVA